MTEVYQQVKGRFVLADMFSYRRVLSNESQAAAAERAGIPFQSVIRLETREIAPDREDLEKIAAYMHCDVADLVDSIGDIIAVQDAASAELNDNMRYIHQAGVIRHKNRFVLRRMHEFTDRSPYYQRVNANTIWIDQESLPQTQIGVARADRKELEMRDKMNALQQLVTAPFARVIELSAKTS